MMIVLQWMRRNRLLAALTVACAVVLSVYFFTLGWMAVRVMVAVAMLIVATALLEAGTARMEVRVRRVARGLGMASFVLPGWVTILAVRSFPTEAVAQTVVFFSFGALLSLGGMLIPRPK